MFIKFLKFGLILEGKKIKVKFQLKDLIWITYAKLRETLNLYLLQGSKLIRILT